MNKYNILDIATVILVIIGFAFFYKDLSAGKFNAIITLYFVALAAGYFLVIHFLHLEAKNVMREVAKNMGCQFEDSGKYSLSHKIKCENMEIVVNFRGSYTPASIHITLWGTFHKADVRAGDPSSKKLAQLLRDLERKYRIRVNDAYISKDTAEAIITKFPYNSAKLQSLLTEFREIVSKV